MCIVMRDVKILPHNFQQRKTAACICQKRVAKERA